MITHGFIFCVCRTKRHSPCLRILHASSHRFYNR